MRVANENGRTTLHVAAAFSSPSVVALLLHAGALATARAMSDSTALHSCCLREFADVTVPIATLLLDAGAGIEARNDELDTPLIFACGYGSTTLVKLLLARGANALALNSSGHTTLMYACDNAQYGPEIVPLLIAAGVDVDRADHDGRTALNWAFSRGAVALEALAPHVVPARQFAHRLPSTGCPDPIGAMAYAVQFGFSCNSESLRDAVAGSNPASYCWALLRFDAAFVYDNSDRDFFRVMASCADARLWWLVAAELLVTRYPVSMDTLLHVAARANNADAVRACCSHMINPLLRNNAGELAVDCTTDKAVRALLVKYATWRPDTRVTHWFGPYFRGRARAWLLVCQHWRSTRVRAVQREMQLRVVYYIAQAEETDLRIMH